MRKGQLDLDQKHSLGASHDEIDLSFVDRPPIANLLAAMALEQLGVDAGFKDRAKCLSLEPFEPQHLHESRVTKKDLGHLGDL